MKNVRSARWARHALIATVIAGAALGMADVACELNVNDVAKLLDLDVGVAAKSVGSVGFARPAADTVPAGDAMLVLYEDKDVGVFDLGDPTSPEAGAEIPTSARVIAADFDEEREVATLVDASGTVTIAAVRSAAGTAVLATATVPELGGDAKALVRVGDRLFVLGSSRLFSLRIGFTEDEPSSLTPEAPIALDGSATHLAAGGDTLYVGQGGVVTAWTVPADGPPARAGAFTVGGEIRGLLAKGSKLVALAKGAGLKVVDFGDATRPTVINHIPDLKDVAAAKLFGRTLAVGLERGSFHTIDISDFARPRTLTTNKGELPKFLSVQGGNLFFGSGSRGEVGGVPPVVAAAVPTLQREDFPLDAPMPVVFSKPIDPASVSPESVRLLCGGQPVAGTVTVSPDRLTVSFRPAAALPAGASCALDVSAVRDGIGLAVSGGSNPAKVDFKTSKAAPAPVTNGGSSYKHVGDGAFTDWSEGAQQYEWFDVKPAKGMYSYFYADFDGTNLWLLNDWFFAGEKIDPDCYNQFGVWTGGGAERWEIRAYGNKKIEVRKNGELLDKDKSGVEGGYSFGPSPNVKTAHTMYELKIPASAGRWGVQLHDPGPTFHCSRRMGDPSPLQGGLGADSGGAKASSVERAKLTPPAAPSASAPENGATQVSFERPPTLAWGAEGGGAQFVAYVVQLSKDESFRRPVWQRFTYGSSLPLPRGLLAGGQTYYWRVLAWSWVGSATSQVFRFTTVAPPPKPEADAGADASVEDAAPPRDSGTTTDAGTCSAQPAPSCTSNIDMCSCSRDYNGAGYSMNCTGGVCACLKDGKPTGEFQTGQTCTSQQTAAQAMVTRCPCN